MKYDICNFSLNEIVLREVSQHWFMHELAKHRFLGLPTPQDIQAMTSWLSPSVSRETRKPYARSNSAWTDWNSGNCDESFYAPLASFHCTWIWNKPEIDRWALFQVALFVCSQTLTFGVFIYLICPMNLFNRWLFVILFFLNVEIFQLEQNAFQSFTLFPV